MKVLIKMVFIIIILMAIWIVYVNRKAAEREEEYRELQHMKRENLRQETEKDTLVLSPIEAVSYTPDSSVVVNRVKISKRAEIFKAAETAGITIVNYKEKENKSIIDCRSTNRNNLGLFLDELMNRGIIKNIDLDKTKYHMTVNQGKRWHWAHYEIRW
jgi:hypothetical protein